MTCVCSSFMAATSTNLYTVCCHFQITKTLCETPVIKNDIAIVSNCHEQRLTIDLLITIPERYWAIYLPKNWHRAISYIVLDFGMVKTKGMPCKGNNLTLFKLIINETNHDITWISRKTYKKYLFWQIIFLAHEI